jgi:hypothetical protein
VDKSSDFKDNLKKSVIYFADSLRAGTTTMATRIPDEMPGAFHGSLEALFPISRCSRCGNQRFLQLAFCKDCAHSVRFACERCGKVYGRAPAVECLSCDPLRKYVSHHRHRD